MRDGRPRYAAGVWAVVAASLLSNGAFFLMFPLLPIHLTARLGFDATTTGLILGLRILLEQAGGPLGGTFADRFGYRRTIVGGLVLRAIGLGSLVFAVDVIGVLASTLIAALGGSLFNPSGRAIIANIVPVARQQSAFALLTMSIWAAQCIGPLIGSFLYDVAFLWIGVATSLTLTAALLPTFLLLPATLRAPKQPETFLRSLITPMRDGEFRVYLLPHMLSWVISMQGIAIMPLLAAKLGGPQAVGTVFLIQAAFAVSLQLPIMRFASRRVAPLSLLTISAGISAIGLLGYATANSVVQVAVFSVLFGITSLLVLPGQAFIIARFAGDRQGAYYGTAGIAQGIGGFVGSIFGGALWDVGTRLEAPWLGWTLMAGIALTAAGGYFALNRHPRIGARVRFGVPPAAQAVTPQT